MRKFFLFFIFPAIISAQQEDTTLISFLNLDLFINVKPSYEIASVNFFFLDSVKIYDFYSKQISSVNPEIKTSGLIFYDFTLGLNYKKLSLSGRFITTELSPAKPNGRYEKQNGEVLNKMDRGISKFLSINLQYTLLKYAKLNFGIFVRYENAEMKYWVSKGQSGMTYLDGGYKFFSNMFGFQTNFLLARFSIYQNIGASYYGKYSFNFYAADTFWIPTGEGVDFSLKPFGGSGKLNNFYYEAGVGCEIWRDIWLDLFFEYRNSKGEGFFREKQYKFGLKFTIFL